MKTPAILLLCLAPIALCWQSFTVARPAPGAGFAFDYQASRREPAPAQTRAQAHAGRQYQRGQRAIDREQWQIAVNHFDEVIRSNQAQADGALYWKAFALARLGKTTEAVAALETLAKTYSQSRWLSLAASLQAQAASGTAADAASDDLKLAAIRSLMNTDPERAIPLLEKVLSQPASPKLHDRVLVVLSHSGFAKAQEIVANIAKGGANPDLQLSAIRALSTAGGASEILKQIYGSSNDEAMKKAVLDGYLVAGDRDSLISAAKNDTNIEMRNHAIAKLGAMGANSQLADLYASETSPELRGRLLRALFVSGNIAKLIELARTETDPELRAQAIQHLGALRSDEAAEALTSMYQSNTEPELRKRILRSLFVQGNAKQLIAVARNETNFELKKQAIQHLSHMRSEEASAYLMELLK